MGKVVYKIRPCNRKYNSFKAELPTHKHLIRPSNDIHVCFKECDHKGYSAECQRYPAQIIRCNENKKTPHGGYEHDLDMVYTVKYHPVTQQTWPPVHPMVPNKSWKMKNVTWHQMITKELEDMEYRRAKLGRMD